MDINVLNIAAPNITHCNINHNSQTGIKYFTRASTFYTFNPYNEISNNTIIDNGNWGIEIQFNVKIANASLLVNHNVIENNSAGISFLVYVGNLTLTHNTIIRNDGSGVHCDYHNDFFDEHIINISILNNLILYNDGNGIFVAGSTLFGSRFNSIVVEHNTILSNRDVNDQNGGGINFEQHKEDAIIFRYNNIYNNTPYDARNGREFDINISHNWWGTTKSEIIEQHIHDYYDDFNKGKLNYTPFLTKPDPDAPDASTYIVEPPDTPTTPIDTDENNDVIIPILFIVIVIIIVIIGVVVYRIKRK